MGGLIPSRILVLHGQVDVAGKPIGILAVDNNPALRARIVATELSLLGMIPFFSKTLGTFTDFLQQRFKLLQLC